MTRVVVVVGGDKTKIKRSQGESELEFFGNVCSSAALSSVLGGKTWHLCPLYFLADTPTPGPALTMFSCFPSLSDASNVLFSYTSRTMYIGVINLCV